MGVYNRDYMRDEGGSPGGGLMSGPANWSVITWLLVINCAVFLVQHLFLAPADARRSGWSPWGGLDPIVKTPEMPPGAKTNSILEDPPEYPLANVWRRMKVGEIIYL